MIIHVIIKEIKNTFNNLKYSVKYDDNFDVFVEILYTFMLILLIPLCLIMDLILLPFEIITLLYIHKLRKEAIK